jgi:hypothetical protein
MSRLLLSLWLIGAALIAGSTLAALDAIFGWTSGTSKFERTYIAERRAIALGRVPAPEGAPQPALEPQPAQPAQGTSRAATSAAGDAADGAAPERIAGAARAPESAAARPNGERARVADKAAAVRAGPSDEAAMLFGFPHGRELRVLSREAGYAEIVDLRSKATGWIAESALERADAKPRLAAPQRRTRSAPYASLAPSEAVALPADETMRAARRERPGRKARQARRDGFFARAIRRGLGGG